MRDRRPHRAGSASDHLLELERKHDARAICDSDTMFQHAAVDREALVRTVCAFENPADMLLLLREAAGAVADRPLS